MTLGFLMMAVGAMLAGSFGHSIWLFFGGLAATIIFGWLLKDGIDFRREAEIEKFRKRCFQLVDQCLSVLQTSLQYSLPPDFPIRIMKWGHDRQNEGLALELGEAEKGRPYLSINVDLTFCVEPAVFAQGCLPPAQGLITARDQAEIKTALNLFLKEVTSKARVSR